MTPDERPPASSTPPLERRLATILCADVYGYSRMMGANDERTVRVFRGHRQIFESLVAMHRGRIFSIAGDMLLAEFGSAVEAVRCATEIQAALRTRNEQLAPEEKMQLRIGINLGDVVVQGGDLLGDGVNVAARIQAATEPGGICISGAVHDQIQNKLSLSFKLLVEQTYKNIAAPVRTYTVAEGAAVTTPRKRPAARWATAAIAAMLATGAAAYWAYTRYEARRAIPVLARDGTYSGRMCNILRDKAPQCWPAILVVRTGAVESAWRSFDERTSSAHGTIGADGAVELKLAGWTPSGEPNEAALYGRLVDGAINASGKWRSGGEITGTWRSAQAAARGAKGEVQYDGKLCMPRQSGGPNCWSVSLSARDGRFEGSWLGRMNKTARAIGKLAADGSVQLKLLAWRYDGTPIDGTLSGRVDGDAINASGQWSDKAEISGHWSRRL
jgi:class 3 adenylate cyclase